MSWFPATIVSFASNKLLQIFHAGLDASYVDKEQERKLRK